MSSRPTNPISEDAAVLASRIPDTLTIIATAVVAGAITNVLHEGLGHGGACVLSGGQGRVLSSVAFDCSFDSRFIAAGGTIVNFIAGIISLSVARAIRPSRLRYFFWLLMVFNLLDAAGYFLYSGVGNIGDWAEVIRGLQPAFAWRFVLTVVGVILYAFFVFLSAHELAPMLSREFREKLSRARRFTFVPYFTVGVLHTISGTLNPFGAQLVFISAMAASFGGKSGMLWMGLFFRGDRFAMVPAESPPFERSWGWIVGAIAVAIVFIVVLGRGIRF
jgi:hypothetical protein